MAAKYEGLEKFIFSDAYNFFLKYRDMASTDNNWELCIAESNMLANKYRNHPLATSILASVIHQLEHKVNGGAVRGYTDEQWEILLKDSHKIGLN